MDRIAGHEPVSLGQAASAEKAGERRNDRVSSHRRLSFLVVSAKEQCSESD
ncbi:hypothetical protein [Kamptonema formosum]|uniref:hypothetical protein n=1 Tax=Kamptonema formosum TaxID=331992 RepID=UPI00034BBA9B|nr:hypothetical protein [Oscillatoria sp. PCC 10802]